MRPVLAVDNTEQLKGHDERMRRARSIVQMLSCRMARDIERLRAQGFSDREIRWFMRDAIKFGMDRADYCGCA